MTRRLIVSLLLGLFLLLPGAVLAQDDTEIYTDPQGLFTIPVPENWIVTEAEDGSYVKVTDPDEMIALYIGAEVAEEDLELQIAEFVTKVAPEFDAEIRDTVETTDPALLEGFETSVAVVYDTPLTQVAASDASVFEGVAYLSFVDADVATLQRRAAQFTVVATGFQVLAMEQTDLTGVEVQPITEAMLTELEAFINRALQLSEVPGLSIAIVQDDEIIYSAGFGVTEQGGDTPVTPDTHMMIGSTTKTMTTMAMAAMVDEGLMQWDTPVVEILPSFAVADSEITEELNVSHLVCACTGVPRRDFELVFDEDLTPQGIFDQLATFEFFTDFGETFQYSNQMVAAGGYVAAVADGVEYDNLYEGYIDMMQERIFDPIEMPRTTFSFDDVRADGDYALPHGANLDNEFYVMPLSIEEGFVASIIPAGGVWSTANDMAQYVLTALNEGTAPNGTQVVSAENLHETWQPQVQISADISYGLGWIIEDYNGVRVLSHDGNMLGYTSDMAFLPDAGIGIVSLTNARATNFINQAIRERLLEMVFDQEPKIEAQMESLLAEDEEEDDTVNWGEIDAAEVEPFLGEWTNPVLGEITLEGEDGMLIMDSGAWRSEIRPYLDDDGEFQFYLMYEMPLAGVDVYLNTLDDGMPQLVVGSGVTEYTFERVE